MTGVPEPAADVIIPPIEPGSALALFTQQDDTGRPNGLDFLLEKVHDFKESFRGDASTKEGRAAIASAAFKITKAKTSLEAEGKRLADEMKAVPKKIDAARKYVRETLDKWHQEVRAPLDAWEQAEAERLQRHQYIIDGMSAAAVVHVGTTATEIRQRIAKVEAVSIGLDCEEFAADYARTKDAALTTLRNCLATVERAEIAAAELAIYREQEAARQRAEDEAKAAADAARRAEEEAQARQAAEKHAAAQAVERERQAAAEREAALIRDREAAERRAHEAEQKAARDLEAKKAAELAEAERREANKIHRAAVHRAALADCVANGIPEEQARATLKLIAAHKIRHVVINY